MSVISDTPTTASQGETTMTSDPSASMMSHVFMSEHKTSGLSGSLLAPADLALLAHLV